MNHNYVPYRDCHAFYELSQWRVLFDRPGGTYRDCHGFFQSLAMTSLWILPFAPFVIARSETTKQSTTTNNQYKNKKKKKSLPFALFVIARVRRTRGNPQTTKPPPKTENKKNSLLIQKQKTENKKKKEFIKYKLLLFLFCCKIKEFIINKIKTKLRKIKKNL